jgi:hypothetical protein
MKVNGTYLDMHTPGSPSWDCVALESDAAMTPGHIWQLSEYIPAMANGLIADYPSWWMTDASWSSEVDMAEAQDWGGNASPQGAMCLDIHLDQGTENTTPDCVTETGGWHTYTFVWAADGAVMMYYDGSKVSPEGVSGTTATDMHMIIWNNNNGGVVDSTLEPSPSSSDPVSTRRPRWARSSPASSSAGSPASWSPAGPTAPPRSPAAAGSATVATSSSQRCSPTPAPT